jgi:hypothetical protein
VVKCQSNENMCVINEETSVHLSSGGWFTQKNANYVSPKKSSTKDGAEE